MRTLGIAALLLAVARSEEPPTEAEAACEDDGTGTCKATTGTQEGEAAKPRALADDIKLMIEKMNEGMRKKQEEQAEATRKREQAAKDAEIERRQRREEMKKLLAEQQRVAMEEVSEQIRKESLEKKRLHEEEDERRRKAFMETINKAMPGSAANMFDGDPEQLLKKKHVKTRVKGLDALRAEIKVLAKTPTGLGYKPLMDKREEAKPLYDKEIMKLETEIETLSDIEGTEQVIEDKQYAMEVLKLEREGGTIEME
jgi:hypothetical protein